MTQDLESERELARRAGKGEEAAWRLIYESTCDPLFALLVYQVGDRDEARDLLQETYLQAYRRLEAYRAEAPLAVWLRAIALRKAMDWKRGVLRRLKRNVPLLESIPAQGPPAEVHFESERAALSTALTKLSPQQRAALLLREWEERSFREIAEVLGCNESTARVHHTRARVRMRALLGQELVPQRAGDWEGQQA
jgi:RNA polymerase sigma-70 factor (ECF subfamily)